MLELEKGGKGRNAKLYPRMLSKHRKPRSQDRESKTDPNPEIQSKIPNPNQTQYQTNPKPNQTKPNQTKPKCMKTQNAELSASPGTRPCCEGAAGGSERGELGRLWVSEDLMQ
jgi:hypothetical protein